MRGSVLKVAAAFGLGLGAGAALKARRARARFRFRGKSVVITGGSRGLGFVLARELAREGARVALLARDPQELYSARWQIAALGTEVITIACDVRDRRQVDEAIGKAADRFGGLDVLINNAGTIQVGPLEHVRIEDFEEAMAVHFWGPLHTTLAALPHLRRRGGGRIVNISSIGGKIAIPHLLPYSASKFALVGLSDGLRAELKRDGIAVTTVCPGLMRTGSAFNATFKGRHPRECAWFAISSSMPLITASAERAARQIIEACRRQAPRLVITWPAKAAIATAELFPATTARLLDLVNRLLPKARSEEGNDLRTGWDCRSALAPSVLTALSNRAARRNNELVAREKTETTGTVSPGAVHEQQRAGHGKVGGGEKRSALQKA